MKRNAVAEVMAEPCLYGGLLATRGQVYEDLSRLRGPHGAGMDALWLDRLTWMCPAASPEDVADLTTAGLMLKAIQDNDSVKG